MVEAGTSLGIKELHTYWACQCAPGSTTPLSQDVVKTLLAGLGLNVLETLRYLHHERPSYAQFEAWIDELIAVLRAFCEIDSDVTAGYIVEVLRGDNQQDASLLVAIAAPKRVAERVSRSSMQRVRPHIDDLALPLIMTVIEPEEGASRFYQRAIQFYGKP